MNKPKHLQKSVRINQTVHGVRPVLKELTKLRWETKCKKENITPTVAMRKMIEMYVDDKINLS